MLLSGILRAARAIASALIGGDKWRSGTNLMVNGLWSGWERSSATEGTFLFRNFVRLFRNFVSRQGPNPTGPRWTLHPNPTAGKTQVSGRMTPNGGPSRYAP